MSAADFVGVVGGAYEKTPWVAEKAHAAGPYESLAALAARPSVPFGMLRFLEARWRI